jgi:predicted dehydrogenase
MSKLVRFGIVGLGNIGKFHLQNLRSGKVEGGVVTAVCDAFIARKIVGEGELAFENVDEMLASGLIDALIVATPHTSHVELALKAIEKDIHVIVEKPIAVHKGDALRILEAAVKKPELQVAAMLNMRANRCFQKVKELLSTGELGEIRRIHWEVTNWYRTNYYYATGGWRGTWAGEGGGVLMNQCPHNLDIFSWLFGMPEEVYSFCQFGRFHQIEVEDDVTAMMKYSNGATATFITSTGEAPGKNQLEIAGENGRLTVTNNQKIRFQRNRVPMSEFCMTSQQGFAMPECWEMEIPVEVEGNQHLEIVQNFANAIQGKGELISSIEQGVGSVELANAMLLSGWTEQKICLPIDTIKYQQLLSEKATQSTFQKTEIKAAVSAADFTKSFR